MPASPERSSPVDSDLMSRVASGDVQAFGTIYDKNINILYPLALRILNERREAEEVLQDVFLHVWRKASTFDEARGNLISWLVTLTRSRAIDRLRASRARPDLSGFEAGEQEDPAALNDILLMDRRTQVRNALAKLPHEQRIVIELAYFEGLTHTEIAQRLSQPLGTVKTRVRLGMMKLKESLFG